jgi:Icc protein
MIHILQLTDTHLFADPEGSLYSINTREKLQEVIHHVGKTLDQIDVVLLTGDLVHDESRTGYSELKSMLKDFDCPKYYLPGNHDDPTLMHELLESCANGDFVSFVAGSWSLVLLDSSVRGKVEGAISDDTLTRLEKHLADSSDKYSLVALHHHIIDVQSPWLDALNLRNHSQLTGLLERFPNVKLVINGHVHQEIDTQLNGIRYLGTPATCFQFAVKSENGGIDDRPPAYRHIVLNDDGSFGTTVYYVA